MQVAVAASSATVRLVTAAGGARHRFGRSLVGIIALSVLLLTACAEEEPQEFTDANKAGFMAACADLVEGARFIGETCECVFEQTQEEFSFTRFATIDQQLVDNPERPLSDAVVEIVADCVIAVTEL